MKIALFDSDGTLGGAQRSLLDLACGLLARHCDVIAILGAPGPLCHAYERLNIPVFELPLGGQPTVRTVMRLARFCRQMNVRHLYASSSNAAYIGSLAMRLIHGSVYWRILRSVQFQENRWYTRIAARCSQRIIVARQDQATALRTLVGKRPNIQIIPPAINLDRYPQHHPPVRKPGERPVIGMLGAWEPLSGYDVLIKAFRILHDSGQPARLRLASVKHSSRDEGRYLAMLQGAVKASGLTDRIIVEGEIHDLPGYFARCDVIVAPLLRETSGRLALEAAAIGRPIVASRVSGMLETIEDGHTGLLIPSNDPRALADALALLLASPALRAEMGRQARIRVEERFIMKPLLDAIEQWLHDGKITIPSPS
ncbi:MAG TPA: glycosyltransferase family 4 protein [Armatimonadota bacterium]|nr:glycosyltransferase family 4 protein [Armatimonadota bacterium]